MPYGKLYAGQGLRSRKPAPNVPPQRVDQQEKKYERLRGDRPAHFANSNNQSRGG